MRIALRPRWMAGHLVAVTAVVVFVLLGQWQLGRHGERTDLRDAVAAGGELPAVPIAEAVEGSYRRVVASGAYDGEHQSLVLRSLDGASGYHVLTPLVGDDGAVLVDRGWIALDVPPPPPPGGVVTVTGVLWPAQEGTSMPEVFPEVMRRIDPAIHQAFVPYRMRSDYLILTGTGGEGLAAVVPPGIGLGPHLGYAGQWFLFAVVVAVGYPLLLRRAARSATGVGGRA